ncbi:Triacylglycerol lipase 1, partial [Linum perenne]
SSIFSAIHRFFSKNQSSKLLFFKLIAPYLVPNAMMNLILLLASILLQFLVAAGDESTTVRLRTPKGNLCGQVIGRAGYPCTEHTIETTDGYLLALQRVSSRNGNISLNRGPPVLLQHGLFMGGDCWFLNSPEESLGFILADQGFDVWVGNVRGTFWSHGHVSLSEDDKEFWDWSWQELAMYDLAEMIHHIYSATSSKVFLVGHSQGTIMSLAALSQPKIVEMVEAAALLCPISYLDHVTAPLVHKMVTMHVDQMITAMGIHQLNFRRYSSIIISLISYTPKAIEKTSTTSIPSHHTLTSEFVSSSSDPEGHIRTVRLREIKKPEAIRPSITTGVRPQPDTGLATSLDGLRRP